MTTNNKEAFPRWLECLAAVELTLVCLGLAMVLVFFGTLAQVHMGTFAAQKEFFNSWWIFGDGLLGLRLPLFPGGLTIGALWMVNLLAAFAVRFHYGKNDIGLLISHLGVILLLMGQFLTQTLAHESQMPIEIGQSRNYSESLRDTEIALIDVSNPRFDEITSIPYSVFSRRKAIAIPGAPFSLVIQKFYRNANLGMAAGGATSGATEEGTRRVDEEVPGARQSGRPTQGIGTRIGVEELPSVTSDDEVNNVTAVVEVLNGGQSMGTWLISSGLGAPQSFLVEGREYRIYLRPRRTYYPFTLTLKEFRHEIYPGTDIPKNFSSLVHLANEKTGESRDALIYMNHPLRYAGKTFYQASFGKNDMLSIFQVVENPAWITLYASCSLVVLGLMIQFLTHLASFIRERR